jgi:hypothetical protein
MDSRGAKCSRLRDGNEYADVIEIGRFAHVQHSSAALIIALRSSIWDKGEFAIQEIHGNLETLGTAQQTVSVNALFDLTPESSANLTLLDYGRIPSHPGAMLVVFYNRLERSRPRGGRFA